MQAVVRRLQAHLENAPRSDLALVEIGTAEPAAVAIATLAVALASQGKRVVLADAAEHRPLAKILRAKGERGSWRTVSVRGQSLELFVAPADPSTMADETVSEDAEVRLVLATVDPAFGADHLTAWAGNAVVLIQAGEATPPRIDGIARQLRHARIAILSGMLIGADRYDHSSGALPLRARSAEPADRFLETFKASAQ